MNRRGTPGSGRLGIRCAVLKKQEAESGFLLFHLSGGRPVTGGGRREGMQSIRAMGFPAFVQYNEKSAPYDRGAG